MWEAEGGLGECHGSPQPPRGLSVREGPGLVQTLPSAHLHALDFARCTYLPLSLFFREAGHGACEKSVPFSPVRSTLATSPQDSAAPSAWVSASCTVKEQGRVSSGFSAECALPHVCLGVLRLSCVHGNCTSVRWVQGSSPSRGLHRGLSSLPPWCL